MRVPCAEFSAGVVLAQTDAVTLRFGGGHERKGNCVADSDDDVSGIGGSSSGTRPGSRAQAPSIQARGRGYIWGP